MCLCLYIVNVASSIPYHRMSKNTFWFSSPFFSFSYCRLFITIIFFNTYSKSSLQISNTHKSLVGLLLAIFATVFLILTVLCLTFEENNKDFIIKENFITKNGSITNRFAFLTLLFVYKYNINEWKKTQKFRSTTSTMGITFLDDCPCIYPRLSYV